MLTRVFRARVGGRCAVCGGFIEAGENAQLHIRESLRRLVHPGDCARYLESMER